MSTNKYNLIPHDQDNWTWHLMCIHGEIPPLKEDCNPNCGVFCFDALRNYDTIRIITHLKDFFVAYNRVHINRHSMTWSDVNEWSAKVNALMHEAEMQGWEAIFPRIQTQIREIIDQTVVLHFLEFSPVFSRCIEDIFGSFVAWMKSSL